MQKARLQREKHQTWLEDLTKLEDVYQQVKGSDLPSKAAYPQHFTQDMMAQLQKFTMSLMILRRHIYSMIAQLRAQLAGEQSENDFMHVDFLSDLEAFAPKGQSQAVVAHPALYHQLAEQQLFDFLSYELQELQTVFVDETCDDLEDVLAAKLALSEFASLVDGLKKSQKLLPMWEKFYIEQTLPASLQWCYFERLFHGNYCDFMPANDDYSHQMVS